MAASTEQLGEHGDLVAESSKHSFVVTTKNKQLLNFDRGHEGSWNGPFLFIQAADTQFGMIASYLENDTPRWDKEVDLTRKAVSAANRMNPRPRFFVVCGDLVDAWPETQEELRTQQERDFKDVFAHLDQEIPLVCICGNHDVGNTPTPDTVARYRNTFGDDFFSFWVGGVFFIALNSQYYWDRSKVEEIASEQDHWLEEQLSMANTAVHAIVFQHIPWFTEFPDEPKTEYFNIEPVTRKQMLDKFKKAGVKTVFCGHYHRNAGGFDENLEVVVTSAIGAQLGSDTHGLRIVQVTDNDVSHRYYGVDEIPANVSFTKGPIANM